jgi:selenocysteine lyase/cysteine desulfurase
MLSGAGGMEGLSDMKDVELYGPRGPERTDQRVPTFTFNIIDADPHEVAQYFWDKHAIALLAENSGGFYSRTLKTYGKTIGVRASLAHFNTVQEIAGFLSGLADAVRHFKAA